METLTAEFTHTVETVAREIFKNYILEDGQLNPTVVDKIWVGPYLRVLTNVLKQTKPDGDTVSKDQTFAYDVLGKLFDKLIKARGNYDPQSATFAMAAAIINKDKCLDGLSDQQVRLLLDTAMDVPIEFFSKAARRAERGSSYELDSQRGMELFSSFFYNRQSSDHYLQIQAKLRERVTVGASPERK